MCGGGVSRAGGGGDELLHQGGRGSRPVRSPAGVPAATPPGEGGRGPQRAAWQGEGPPGLRRPIFLPMITK